MQDHEGYELRAVPEDERLVAEAHSKPSGWVYEIDFEYAPEDAVPPEAIMGAWEVSASGTLTGLYKPNPRYRSVAVTNRELPAYMHAAARHAPGRWMAEIAKDAEHLFPNIPDGSIAGWWLIGADGVISKRFRPNSLYEPAN